MYNFLQTEIFKEYIQGLTFDFVMLTSVKLIFLPAGTYLYIETSDPSRTGDSAILMSELFTSTDALCFHFFYNMYGETVGTLRIWLALYNTSSNNLAEINHLVIWELRGNQSDAWHEGITPIKQQQYSFKVIFSAHCSCPYMEVNISEANVTDGEIIILFCTY